MTITDRIRRLRTIGFVVAAAACLHAGASAQVVTGPTKVPNNYPQFGPNHQTEAPGFGLPQSPIMPNYGIDPVFPGSAQPHSRPPTAFFPMVKDSRLTFPSALAADSVAIGGFGFGGFGYWGMGVGTSLPPMRGFGARNYLAGDPAAGNGSQTSLGAKSEDAFDNAASGRPSATRPARPNRVKATRRLAARKSTPQPSSTDEAKVTDEVPSRPGASGARPQQASKSREKPGSVKSEESKPAPRRSMLGPQ